MEFKVVTPKKIDGLPQQPSYLLAGNPLTINVRLIQSDDGWLVAKCDGPLTRQTHETQDFQSALYCAVQMWNGTYK